MCVCVCVCVTEREGERPMKQRTGGEKREKKVVNMNEIEERFPLGASIFTY